ncbi:hypothetical protein BJV82DRAFT_215980 [Fennellomyces sp. T-0311]|nr:hypothetical protein BJV82DRAFT_215980 [Fennellomyces sp. T-0311]
MDPSRCSVVVSFQPAPPPFIIEDQVFTNNPTNDQPAYTSLLQSVFGQVFVHSNPADALERVKQIKHGSPTLLLIDLDSTVDDDQADDDDDDDTVYTPSCSSSCSTASSSSGLTDSRLAWIKKSSHTLSEDVPVIACSSDDNTAFMLDCIHAGAADYLLKPLRLDVIKTLFLKLHRCRPDSKMHEADAPPAFLPSSPSVSLPDNVSTLCPDDGLQHRIKEIFTKDTRFAQSVMDIYANPPVQRIKYRGLTGERATVLQHKVSSWDFNPFEFSHDDLIHCAYLILEQALVSPELQHLTISQDQLYDFIIELSGAYHDGNPYHNFAHAVDVLQCLYYFLCRLGLLSFANMRTNHATNNVSRRRPQDLLRPKDIFALLIAALGHDAAHPGVNNAFLINAGAPLALLYNDRSVLESFHSMTLFQIIKKHGLDQIGGGPGSADYQAFRKIVVTSILATDMSLHADYVEQINAQAHRLPRTDLHALDEQACEKERLLLCSAIIKCADISNVTRPFLRAAKWAELLVEESVSQGDLERVMGLPVLPMNDRDKIVLEDSQIGFIRFVALELFDSVRQVLPEMSFTVDCMRDNLRRWESRKHAQHHDSGVASLTEEPLAGCKRRSNSLDYHSQAVEVLRKRLSLDTNRGTMTTQTRRRSAGDFRKLPPAAAVAMQTFHEPSPPPPLLSPPSPPQQQPVVDRRHEWSHDDTNPVYCQCAIQ